MSRCLNIETKKFALLDEYKSKFGQIYLVKTPNICVGVITKAKDYRLCRILLLRLHSTDMMARYVIACFLLMLICNQQQFGAEAKKKSDLMSYGIEDAINDINFFIPGSKAILTLAVKIWLVCGEVKQVVNSNTTQVRKSLEDIENSLSEMSDQLDNISDNIYIIKDDIRELNEMVHKDVIDGVAKEESLFNILHFFENNIASVESQYNNFLQYSSLKRKHENETLLNFANKVIDLGLHELPAVVDRLHGILIAKPLGKSALDLLADNDLSSTMMCKRAISPQHKINSLYNQLANAEMKNLLMRQFAYELKNTFNDKTTFKTEIDETRENSYKRISQSIKFIKKAMTNALREFWICGVVEMREGETYAKLGPVFQTYIAKEKDTNRAASCHGGCSSRTYEQDSCSSNFCKKHKNPCKGFLRDCATAKTSKLQVCLPENDNSSLRYEYIYNVDSGDTFGNKKKCSKGKEIFLSTSRQPSLYKCDICMCTCETENFDIDRYFSLRPVTSDVHENKIVTGVRLQKENNIFHIQIKQGTLLKNGNVNASSNEWKVIDNFTIYNENVLINFDYHMITYDKRTVYLDDIDSPLNHVLTGLRFAHDKDYLKLEIQVTPFDFDTGVLKTKKAMWLSNAGDTHSRTFLQIKGLDLPTSTTYNRQDSSSNQYINFTTSSMRSDVGQTVVPYLEFQALETTPPVPLSGAGLIHKADDKTAGFIAFKIYTYNFAPHLQS